MGSNFNNDVPGPSEDPQDQTPVPAEASSPAPAASGTPESAAVARFKSCRWMQPAENGNAAFCTHREVKPYAGTAGFDADAWCPECQYYKLRRAPRKRNDDNNFSY